MGLGGAFVELAGDGDGAEAADLLFELEDGELGVEVLADLIFEGDRGGNSSRILFNLGDIGERGEGFGAGPVGVVLDGAVGLEEANLSQGGLIGPFLSLVVAVDLLEIGFGLFG